MEAGRKVAEGSKTWQFVSSPGKQEKKKSMTFILPPLKFQSDGPSFGFMFIFTIIELVGRIFLLIKTSKAYPWNPFCGVCQMNVALFL